jgi:hypothetical protein
MFIIYEYLSAVPRKESDALQNFSVLFQKGKVMFVEFAFPLLF